MPCIAQLIPVALLAAGWLQSAESGLAREGAYWVQTISGSQPVAPGGRLRLTAGGPVTVHGGSLQSCEYSVKLRLKARDENEARNRLRGFRVTASRHGDYSLLLVPRVTASSEIHLKVPRTLREVNVSTAEGGVEIYDLDGDVRVGTGGGALKFDRIGGNVEGQTAGGHISLGNVDGAVHCITAGGPIQAGVIRGEAIFETGAGDISAQEVGGMVRASTAGGGIHIVRAGSLVIASTAGGLIDVGRAGGMVTAKSSGGPIHVNAAMGVRCESAGGIIRLKNISGSLRASTAVGSIIAQLLAGQPFADSFLTTGSGDITVFIPSNLGVTIRAENESSDRVSRIVSEFPEIPPKLRGTMVVAEGVINGGGPLLRINGTGGTIFIKRQ